jgi:AdoMet dependent proline di-methyltransferase
VEYWDKQAASYDGVLGGYGHVSETDIKDSDMVLQRVGSRAGYFKSTALMY